MAATESKANVYEKLQAARVDLQQKSIVKSGKNTHAGYSYHELSDFLPYINQILHDRKLCSVVAFTSDLATLTVVNTERPEETITFTSPMAEAALKGVQPIQNAGAVQTYQRRYLYMAAMEIVEHDAVDGSEPESKGTRNKQQKNQQTPPPDAEPPPPTNGINGHANGKTSDDEAALDKGRKAYFAKAREIFDGCTDKDAAKKYAIWSASGILKLEQDLASFNDIPLDQLRRIYQHITNEGPANVLNQYEMLKHERMESDTVPGAEVVTGGHKASAATADEDLPF